MYRSCGVGDCDVPFDRCEIHHLDGWHNLRGHTDLHRLIPACSRHHHHLAHEGGWRLELDPVTRELTCASPTARSTRAADHTSTRSQPIQLDPDADVLFYEGLHGGTVTQTVDLSRSHSALRRDGSTGWRATRGAAGRWC